MCDKCKNLVFVAKKIGFFGAMWSRIIGSKWYVNQGSLFSTQQFEIFLAKFLFLGTMWSRIIGSKWYVNQGSLHQHEGG
jgi:hypothetical protein